MTDEKDLNVKPGTGWIGVDLDGTLAQFTSGTWRANRVGAPILPMLERVKTWLAEGREVRIVTARAGDSDATRSIRAWCVEHLGRELVITDRKDYSMIALYDDLAVQVERNTGVVIADRLVALDEAARCVEELDRATIAEDGLGWYSYCIPDREGHAGCFNRLTEWVPSQIQATKAREAELKRAIGKLRELVGRGLPRAESREPSPYAVICHEHGRVYLTHADYDRQMSLPDHRWACPRCGETSDWDDETYDAYLEAQG